MGVCSDKWPVSERPCTSSLQDYHLKTPFLCSGGVPTAGKALDRGDTVATKKALNSDTIPQ